MPNLTRFLFLKMAITISTEVAEISTNVFMISEIGILYPQMVIQMTSFWYQKDYFINILEFMFIVTSNGQKIIKCASFTRCMIMESNLLQIEETTSNCEVKIDSKLILNGRKVNKIAYAFTFTLSFLFWMCQECL